MADIKTRENVRGIKLLNKASVYGERMKRTFVRSKDQAENLLDESQISPSGYAEDKLRYMAEDTVREAGHEAGKLTRIRHVRSKKTIKAAKARQRTVKRTAKSAGQAAEGTIKTAHESAKAAHQAAKTTAKAIANAARAAAAATKALVAAIAAGGGVALIVIVIICLIAGMVACFGIFFSGEDTGSGKPMRTVVQEINAEYMSRLDAIKAEEPHDLIEMSGSRAVWPEVLSVYAVKVTSDPDNPQEAVTVTPEKEQTLRDIFWAMNTISHSTTTERVTTIMESDDGHGNILEEPVTETRTTLHIVVSHKTAAEMAAAYGFGEQQLEHLNSLLEEGTAEMWAAVLYGVYGADDQIVQVALSQVGNVGGERYWSWYGFGGRVEWCACFVSWCGQQCGYIDSGIMPKFAGCMGGEQWFKSRGLWLDGSAEPAPGMLIFFDWGAPGHQDHEPEHVGIVQKVENGLVYTVEGNSADRVRINCYPVAYYEILGYGVIAR